MDIFYWRESALKCHTTKLLFPKLYNCQKPSQVYLQNLQYAYPGSWQQKEPFFGVAEFHNRIESEWRGFRNGSPLRIVHRVSATFVVVKDI